MGSSPPLAVTTCLLLLRLGTPGRRFPEGVQGYDQPLRIGRSEPWPTDAPWPRSLTGRRSQLSADSPPGLGFEGLPLLSEILLYGCPEGRRPDRRLSGNSAPMSRAPSSLTSASSSTVCRREPSDSVTPMPETRDPSAGARGQHFHPKCETLPGPPTWLSLS